MIKHGGLFSLFQEALLPFLLGLGFKYLLTFPERIGIG